jgi:hypothetical protein
VAVAELCITPERAALVALVGVERAVIQALLGRQEQAILAVVEAVEEISAQTVAQAAQVS